MPTLTIEQAAAVLGVSHQRVRVLCAQRRIQGARKLGRDWRIPEPVTVIPVKRGRPARKA